MSFHICCLGSPQIFVNASPINLRGHRPFALLAYLLVTGKAHTRQHLTDLLFTISTDPRASLRWTLTKLRQTIGPEYILASREQVAFNDDMPHTSDVETLIAGDFNAYHGEFLEGLVIRQAPLFEEWQLFTAQQLRQVYQDNLLRGIEAHALRGEYREVVKLATRLVQLDNLRESWRRTLMRAYAALGERTAALDQYEQCRRLLQTELSVEPSPETIELWRTIRQREFRISRLDPVHPTLSQALGGFQKDLEV